MIPPKTSQTATWTVAIDLAVNLKNRGEFGRMGGEDKMAKLRYLKEASKHSPVKIVVQQIVDDRHTPGGHRLKRFEISNGEVKPIGDQPSKNITSDLKDFLSYVSNNYKSDHLAVTINAHGLGDNGLSGDNGHSSLAQLQKAIHDGLGNRKADVVNLDSCLMAQVGVLKAMEPVAQHLIASSDVEDTDHKDTNLVDGQNLNAWLLQLLYKPDMSAGDLSKAIIQEAENGSNDGVNLTSGTRTLAHFDLTKFDQFEHSLSKFGDTVVDAMKDPGNREAIPVAMELSPGFMIFGITGTPVSAEAYSNQLIGQKRDLNGFGRALEIGVSDGLPINFSGNIQMISDPDGKLVSAVQDLRQRQNELEPEFHTSIKSDIWRTQGLSIFMPPEHLLNTQKTATDMTHAGNLADLSNPEASMFVRRANLANMQKTMAQIESEHGKNRSHLDLQSLRAFNNVEQAWQNVASNKTAPNQVLAAAEDALHDSAQDLLKTPYFQKQIESNKHQLDARLSDAFNVQTETKIPGWGHLLHAVQ